MNKLLPCAHVCARERETDKQTDAPRIDVRLVPWSGAVDGDHGVVVLGRVEEAGEGLLEGV